MTTRRNLFRTVFGALAGAFGAKAIPAPVSSPQKYQALRQLALVQQQSLDQWAAAFERGILVQSLMQTPGSIMPISEKDFRLPFHVGLQ